VALVAPTLLAACGGGDGPTSPGGDGGDPIGQTPSALVFGLDSVRPSEFVTLRPKGLGRAVPDSVIGKI
jgi:hypothetical protein